MHNVALELITTGDGSHSLRIKGTSVTFHSIYGAIQESVKVFIEPGLKDPHIEALSAVRIFECGFGTGLNALLTLLYTGQIKQQVLYETAEPFPLDPDIVTSLNYCDLLHSTHFKETFYRMHEGAYARHLQINDRFLLIKWKTIEEVLPKQPTYDLIYFDPFDPAVEPRLWSETIFEKLYHSTASKGIFLTYSSKGEVRRRLTKAGYQLCKLPGPPGKKEITLARKV